MGPESLVRDYCDRYTQVVDLKGHALLPGFFDAHGHLVLVGLQARSANLLPAPDGEGNAVTTLVRLLSRWAHAHPDLVARTGLILGFGYDDSQLAERSAPEPARSRSRLARNSAVIAIHRSGHLGAVNSPGASSSAGFRRARRIRRRPHPPGTGQHREPNEVLEENAFLRLMAKLTSSLDERTRLEMIRAGSRSARASGTDPAQEARAFSGAVEDLARAAGLGLLDIDDPGLPGPDLRPRRPSCPRRSYGNHFRIGGAKLSLDGSPQGKTAWLTGAVLRASSWPFA